MWLVLARFVMILCSRCGYLFWTLVLFEAIWLVYHCCRYNFNFTIVYDTVQILHQSLITNNHHYHNHDHHSLLCHYFLLHHHLGESCMWAETVDPSDLHNTVWPRAAAVAEVSIKLRVEVQSECG